MVNNGQDALEQKRQIKSIKDIIEKRPVPQDGHYFYVLQMPECGQKRILVFYLEVVFWWNKGE